MLTFIATLKNTVTDPSSMAFQQANQSHAPYYQALIPDGKFLMSGPTLTEDGQFKAGLFLIRAPSWAAAHDIMAHDPLVAAGFADYQLLAFKPLLTTPALDTILNDQQP